MNNLVPFTIEELNQMKGIERTEALIKYKEWLNKQRKQDRKDYRQTINKISYFKNQEKCKETSKKQWMTKKLKEKLDKL